MGQLGTSGTPKAGSGSVTEISVAPTVTSASEISGDPGNPNDARGTEEV